MDALYPGQGLDSQEKERILIGLVNNENPLMHLGRVRDVPCNSLICNGSHRSASSWPVSRPGILRAFGLLGENVTPMGGLEAPCELRVVPLSAHAPISENAQVSLLQSAPSSKHADSCNVAARRTHSAVKGHYGYPEIVLSQPGAFYGVAA